MDTLFLILIILISSAYMAFPFFKKGSISTGFDSSDNGRLDELYRRRDFLLTAIKDLEFDRDMGKVSQKDCNEISERYRHNAMTVLREIDSQLSLLTPQQNGGHMAGCPVCNAPVRVEDNFCRQCGEQLLNASL